MKVTKNFTYNEISLPTVRLDATELFDIIRVVSGSDTLKVKIGDYSSAETIELDGLTEIQENLHIFKIPMEISCANISITIKRSFAKISWTTDDDVRARHAVEAFNPYVPWFSFLGNDRLYYPLFAAFVLWPFFDNFGLSIGDFFAVQVSLISVFIVIQLSVKSIISKNRIFYLPKGTFYRRNRDAILMLIIGTIVGVAVTQIAPAIYAEFTSRSEPTVDAPASVSKN